MEWVAESDLGGDLLDAEVAAFDEFAGAGDSVLGEVFHG